MLLCLFLSLPFSLKNQLKKTFFKKGVRAQYIRYLTLTGNGTGSLQNDMGEHMTPEQVGGSVLKGIFPDTSISH